MPIRDIIDGAIDDLLNLDYDLFNLRVSEQCLCARLCHYVQIRANNDPELSHHIADVEFNRNVGGIRKRMQGGQAITVDLVLHGRGRAAVQGRENVLALEMKKSSGRHDVYLADRTRLINLTQQNPIQAPGGEAFVFGFELGVFMVVNFAQNEVAIEYFIGGQQNGNANIIAIPGPVYNI